MNKLYRAAGTVDRDFVGQITYTICLDHPLHELDIEFSFDKQRFQESDVTPALIAETAQICREKYGLTGTEDDVRRAILGKMKTEIHTLATINDEFIGCVHKQLTHLHMHYAWPDASEGCIPRETFEGVLKVTVLVFNVIQDDTHYSLTVRGE